MFGDYRVSTVPPLVRSDLVISLSDQHSVKLHITLLIISYHIHPHLLLQVFCITSVVSSPWHGVAALRSKKSKQLCHSSVHCGQRKGPNKLLTQLSSQCLQCKAESQSDTAACTMITMNEICTGRTCTYEQSDFTRKKDKLHTAIRSMNGRPSVCQT